MMKHSGPLNGYDIGTIPTPSSVHVTTIGRARPRWSLVRFFMPFDLRVTLAVPAPSSPLPRGHHAPRTVRWSPVVPRRRRVPIPVRASAPPSVGRTTLPSAGPGPPAADDRMASRPPAVRPCGRWGGAHSPVAGANDPPFVPHLAATPGASGRVPRRPDARVDPEHGMGPRPTGRASGGAGLRAGMPHAVRLNERPWTAGPRGARTRSSPTF